MIFPFLSYSDFKIFKSEIYIYICICPEKFTINFFSSIFKNFFKFAKLQYKIKYFLELVIRYLLKKKNVCVYRNEKDSLRLRHRPA